MSTATTTVRPLVDFLDLAVPLEIDRLRSASPEQLDCLRQRLASEVPGTGDVAQFRASGTGESAARIAQALALLARQPGGVNAFGRHWCSNHTVCEAER